MIRLALLACLALALAGCGQLQDATGLPDPFGTPHPFQGTGDPRLLNGVLGERPVYVGRIEGLAAGDEIALRKGIAADAGALDVLASETETNGALTLTGVAKPKHVDFALADGGRTVATFAADGDLPLIAANAAQSLSQALGRAGSAPPSTPEPPSLPDVTPPAPPPPATVTSPSAPPTETKPGQTPPKANEPKQPAQKPNAPAAFVRAVKAPSPKEGGPLGRAVADTLAAMGVRIVGTATPDGYAIDGDLTIGGDASGQTEIKIIWTVFSPKGVNLGQAKQTNTLPTQTVRADWNSQAALAGQAAAQSIVQLIAADFNSGH